MNVSLGRSIWKGIRTALVVGAGAFVASLGSDDVAKGFAEAGPYGAGLVLIVGAAAQAGYDYLKRKLA